MLNDKKYFSFPLTLSINVAIFWVVFVFLHVEQKVELIKKWFQKIIKIHKSLVWLLVLPTFELRIWKLKRIIQILHDIELCSLYITKIILFTYRFEFNNCAKRNLI